MLSEICVTAKYGITSDSLFMIPSDQHMADLQQANTKFQDTSEGQIKIVSILYAKTQPTTELAAALRQLHQKAQQSSSPINLQQCIHQLLRRFNLRSSDMAVLNASTLEEVVAGCERHDSPGSDNERAKDFLEGLEVGKALDEEDEAGADCA